MVYSRFGFRCLHVTIHREGPSTKQCRVPTDAVTSWRFPEAVLEILSIEISINAKPLVICVSDAGRLIIDR